MRRNVISIALKKKGRTYAENITFSIGVSTILVAFLSFFFILIFLISIINVTRHQQAKECLYFVLNKK
jgi:hypothetical protein